MRTVPALLQTYMDGNAVAMTKLVKLGPLMDGSYRYFSMLDRDVTYLGNTYIARTGAQMSAFATSADLGVDNAEMDTLPPVAGFTIEGITDQQIQAGELDKVPYVVYAVCYEDLSLGHFIWAGGTIGEQRIKGTGLINLEQRSISNQFKQTIGDVDSTTCRVKKFGSQVGEERYPCEFDISGEWVAFTVSTVDGTDDDLLFTSDDLDQDDDFFSPGLVEWQTGDNTGIENEVGGYLSDSSTGTVELAYAPPNPITVGDTGRIRRECSRNWVGHNSCDTFWGVDKPLHFRGEPAIPVGDEALINVPAVGTPGGGVDGTGEP